MANTLDSLAEVVFRLIKEAAFKMFVVIIVFIILAFISILLFDRVTATFSLRRIDRSLSILEHLNQLDTSKNPDLEPIKKKLINDLDIAVDPKPLSEDLHTPSTASLVGFKSSVLESEIWIRFLSGMSPWLLFSLFALKQMWNGENNSGAGFLAVIFVGCLAGLFGFLLPGNGWLFYILYPSAQLVAMVVLAIFIATKATQKATKPNSPTLNH